MNAQLQPNQSPPPEPCPPGPDTHSALPTPPLAILPEPPPAKRTRNGKIARLPYLERDMVNRMLRNGIPYDKIRGALDEHGFHVTERNISNWKTRGGYHDWCAEHDRALDNHLLQDNLLEHLRTRDATALPEIGLQLAATHLSRFFLQPETQKQLATAPEQFARIISMICRLARHLHSLQKYRDDSAKELGHKFNPERIKRQAEEHIEITRSVYSAAKLGETIHEPDTPHRNYLPRNSDTPIEPLDHP